MLPYLGAGTGMRQGELFGLAVDEVDFRRKVVHVRRQVRLIGDVACFAPVKNNKAHDVPLSDSLAPLLADHIRRYLPVAMTRAGPPGLWMSSSLSREVPCMCPQRGR